MDKDLVEKADKILDAVLTGISSGIEQLPQITEEYLTYFMFEEIGWLLLSFFWLLPAIALFVISRYMKKWKKDDWFMPGIFGIIFVASFTINFGGGVLKIAKLKYAPKAYLIEKIRK